MILDAGCGYGDFIKKNPEKTIGVDWNKTAIEKCRENNFKVINSDVRSLPLKDKSIQGINCAHVIEHYLPEDVYKILKEFDRVLGPKGILIIRSHLFTEDFYNLFSHVKPYPPHSITKYLIPYESDFEMTFKNISDEYEVIYEKFRYAGFPLMGYKPTRKILIGLDNLGVPLLTKNGYMLVFEKG